VVVIGGGMVGQNAASVAIGMGANVTILDRSIDKLRELDNLFQGKANCLYSTGESIAQFVQQADLLIGAVLIPGASAPKLVSKEMLKSMKQGAVMVDVAIDQGGCFATSKATTHQEPTYTIDGVIHYCVSNMPGAVPLTSSHALNNATLPHAIQLANHGWQALKNDPHLLNGLNIYQGQLTHRAVAQAQGRPFTDLQNLL